MRIGFITCADLSRYFVSAKNPLLTHDDQAAADFLKAHGHDVLPLVWGTSIGKVVNAFDLVIVRSPWDYMDSEETRIGFFSWLRELHTHGVRILNPFSALEWNLDKHYLEQLRLLGVPVVPTLYLEPGDDEMKIDEAIERYGKIVVKPCIAAAAKDAYLVDSGDLPGFKSDFATIRSGRAFMIQPFIEAIRESGEWSLVFIGGEYSHAVLKKAKPGNWLVQDELGGSVRSAEPPPEVLLCAKNAYSTIPGELLYARVDVLGMGSSQLYVGEVELVEPELFFLDRPSHTPNISALSKFLHAVSSF